MFIALGLASVALGVAIGAWFRPTATTVAAPTTPHYSEQEVADAKKAMCEAYQLTYKAVRNAGAQSSSDPTQNFPIAVNTRLTFHAAGDYLFVTLDENPATATELANNIRDLASAYVRTALKQLADVPQSDFAETNTQMDMSDAAIFKVCG